MARTKVAPTAWWECEDEDYLNPLHSRVFSHVRSLEEDQYDIHTQNELNAQLYTNRDVMNFQWQGGSNISFRPLDTNIENVIQSVVDTVVALIAKNRPKATPIARGADFDVYLKARQLDRYLWGEFLSQKLYPKGECVFTDGCVYGTGVLKVDIDDGEIFTERVNPDEIIVDQRECSSTMEPMQMHQRKLVSRVALLSRYGGKKNSEKRDKILTAQSNEFQYLTYRSPGEEQIVVIESWKLPLKGSPGRHTVCIENTCLLDEPYTREWFPFSVFRWNVPQSGWYGRSLVEDLTGYQIRLNELNEVIRVGQDVMCVPRVFVQPGGGIVKSQFDNAIGKIITVRGPTPEAQTWTAFNPEIYAERDRIRASAFEFAGVSELSSQSKLPTQARLDSSEALREYSAIENERFSRQAQAFEEFYLDVATKIIQLSAELFRNQKPVKSQFYRNKYLVQQIDWADVDLEADKYVLQVSASSILNQSPAARKDKLNEWASAGVITMQEYKAWSGQPDLERLADLMTAPHDYVEYVIDKLLDCDDSQTPDPLADLQLVFRTCHDTYLHLRALDAPEEVLQCFRDYIMSVEKMLNPPADPMMAAQPAAGGIPGAAAPPPPPVDPMTGMPMDPAMMGQPSTGMGPGGPPINPMTNTPVPSVSGPAANAFLGQ